MGGDGLWRCLPCCPHRQYGERAPSPHPSPRGRAHGRRLMIRCASQSLGSAPQTCEWRCGRRAQVRLHPLLGVPAPVAFENGCRIGVPCAEARIGLSVGGRLPARRIVGAPPRRIGGGQGASCEQHRYVTSGRGELAGVARRDGSRYATLGPPRPRKSANCDFPQAPLKSRHV